MTGRSIPLILALLLCAGCSKMKPVLDTGLEASARCQSTTAELRFRPDRIEVRVGSHTVAQATTGGRSIDFDACGRIRKQTRWFTSIPYVRTHSETMLLCRFRVGFFIHVHPVYSSQGGEDFPEGSAVYLVVGTKHRLVASATVESNPSRGTLFFVHDYCKPSGRA